jgi:hypothetical protein
MVAKPPLANNPLCRGNVEIIFALAKSGMRKANFLKLKYN